MAHPLADACSRVAFAAYLHDLGKFAERARVYRDDPRLDAHLQLYCPFHREGSWFSHQHAAHSAIALTELESHFPDLLSGDTFPFVGRRTVADGSGQESTDSIVNAAAAHHLPQTFLQWVVATADRVASGFEREAFERYNNAPERRENGLNHFTSRQLTLFEQIQLDGQARFERQLDYRYVLKPMSARSIFPVQAVECEIPDNEVAQSAYRELWEGFVGAITRIPRSHRHSWPLWLDHFDTLWMTYTHSIPSATAFGIKPEVSLYDHSRAVAALAVALWRWHEENGATGEDAATQLKARSDFTENKFLIIQGDFFGIQDFIFTSGGQTRRQAAKLLRGRSFQISLFTELGALRILEELGLPPTSQVINAAGKFMIVAPNTADTVKRLHELRESFNNWFVEHTYGQAGIGLAWTPASCQDFLSTSSGRSEETGFGQLMRRLHQQLDIAKFQRFDLCAKGAKVFHELDYTQGVCAFNGQLPADQFDGTVASCALSRDQILTGQALTKYDRILVVRETAKQSLRSGRQLRVLETDLFGYSVAFTAHSEVTGQFGQLAAEGDLLRCWDFSLPDPFDERGEAALWNGFARRSISGYVPVTTGHDKNVLSGRYDGLLKDDVVTSPDELKTLDMIACEDRTPSDSGLNRWKGIAALGVLKGDIDNLGDIFRVGLRQPTFAKMAALSRQVNGFFVQYLPWLLAREFPNVYTVFAGGDDFFLIGPWRSVQKLGDRLRKEFADYVAHNPQVHFSAGIATQKAGAPIHSMADLAENALGASKRLAGKNAITCFGETTPWAKWQEIESALDRLEHLRDDENLSTSFVYGLLQFVDLHRQELEGVPQAAIWRSRLAYRTRRFVVDKRKGITESQRRATTTRIIQDIGQTGIVNLKSSYRIVLFNHLYQFRDR